METFKCERCEKTFQLKWRLEKHRKGHEMLKVKVCYYFHNKKPCPYEEIGCMFLHMESQMCPFIPCKNSMCQFQHEKQIETMEEESDDEFSIETVENKEAVTEEDFGLNEEIFGFLLKMKEKERLKLVKHF